MLIGFVVFLVGFAIDFSIVVTWVQHGFRNIFAVREALLALTLIVIGLQLVFSSFLLSILNINRETA
jgi:hypothetical protein